MRIEETRPRRYKNYIIVGVAIEAPRLKAWKLRGIVYSNSRKELKRLELKQASFWHKRSAHYHALRMCRYWIDNRQTELEKLRKRQRKAAIAKLKSASRSNRIAGLQGLRPRRFQRVPSPAADAGQFAAFGGEANISDAFITGDQLDRQVQRFFQDQRHVVRRRARSGCADF
jgi:hypothetical protein